MSVVPVVTYRRARGYAPLAWSEEGAEVIARITTLAETVGPGHVAVFDLDGCLFDTRPRQVQIFRELAARAGYDPLYRVAAEHFTDWSIRSTLANAGVEPEWIDANHDAVRSWWELHFFTSTYVLYDHAMPGAAALVRAVHDAGVHCVYLTGRDETMRIGTEDALRRFGFPYDLPGTTLLVKPDFRTDDTEFKEGAIEIVAAMGHVVLYLDNEPANVNLFRRRHPESLVVFVETDHSPKLVEPDPEIPWLRSFLVRGV
ncbi:MAG: HAD hydrolase-like protein [Pseudomonadota bacterium]|nr:HAD hydrolase-like protein [Pseudomonadota bacterium]